MKRGRFILFCLFSFSFFVTAGLTLFNAFGYRFNLERGIFIYTGSVTVKSTPETVDIRINGELVPQKRLGIINNSIHIDGLAPGEHFLEISAPGYVPWSKKIVIHSGLSTEFWNVLLVKKYDVPEVLPQTAFATRIFQALEKGLFAVAKNKEGVFSVDVIDVNERLTDETVFSLENASLFRGNEENIEWDPESEKLIIPAEQENRRLYFVVKKNDKTSFLLNDLVPNDEIKNPRWDPVFKNFLLYQAGDQLYRIDTEATQKNPFLVRENIQTYDISGKNIYYLQKENGIVYKIPVDANNQTTPIQITLTPIDSPEKPYSLVVYDDTRLSLREKVSGALFMFNKSSLQSAPLRKVTEKNVRGVQFSDDGKKLLFFTDNEISVYFTRLWDVQPIREPDTVIQIARFSSLLSNIQWTRDYEHVFFSTDKTIKIIEIDSRDRRNIVDIITTPSSLLQVLSRFEEDALYFITDQKNNGNAVARLFLSGPPIDFFSLR
ncbi:MAG: PEGA domain-containing protein [Candidatus Moranbacteria bacterium]|nr:PEGA domain-containing protein [Candidatus Moranbacteria bacterium]